MKTYAHINWCEWYEGCGDTFGLAHAHSMAKTKITTEEQWMEIAKLCQPHHKFVDQGDGKNRSSHERQRDLILKCIAQRESQIDCF